MSAAALLTLSGASRAWLAFYIALTVLRYFATGLSRIDGSGRGRKLLVAPAAMSAVALGLRNAARMSVLVVVLAAALAMPHVL